MFPSFLLPLFQNKSSCETTHENVFAYRFISHFSYERFCIRTCSETVGQGLLRNGVLEFVPTQIRELKISHIFDELQGVWKCGQTLSQVFDISS